MAKGTVVKVNPPQNAGSIQIDGGTDEYNYNVKAGHTVGGYTPKENDVVNFEVAGGNVARSIEKVKVIAPHCVLKAEPATLQREGVVSLIYSTSDAVRGEFSPRVAEVQIVAGETRVDNVRVTQDTKFTLTVYDAAGNSETCSVTVFIIP